MINYNVDSDGIATITWDMPGRTMNVLNEASMTAYAEALEKALKDEKVKGIILTSGKDTFIAGADLDMLLNVDTSDAAKLMEQFSRLQKMFRRQETGGKPMVAAINGTALGGGFEICLACHYRIAAANPKTKIGQPEVKIGLLPGGGGTQRIPRLIGVMNAAPILLEGKDLSVDTAKGMGLIHEVVPADQLLAKAKEWLTAPAKEQVVPEYAGKGAKAIDGRAVQPWDRKGFKVPGFPGGQVWGPVGVQTFIGGNAMIAGKTFGVYPAPKAIMSCVYEGLLLPFDTALKVETRYFVSLLRDPVAKSMIRTLFFGLQEANKLARRPKGVAKQEYKKIGVLGAGLMGAGIATVSVQAGLEIVLIDRDQAAADKGKAHIADELGKAVKRGRLAKEKAEALLAKVTATPDFGALKGCDLVIEAVFENRDVKAEATKKAEAVLAADAVFASNTSTLPITGLAEASSRPANFIGLHFFSPVEKMPLVEIIVGKKTSPETLARAMDFVQKIRKTPIVVNDSRGFFTSRVCGAFISEGHRLLKEGVPAPMIENCARMAGMPVGPLALNDEVAIDLSWKIMDQTRRDAEAAGQKYEGSGTEDILELMVKKLERFGRKNGKGFYEYPADGKKRLWPDLAKHFPADPKLLYGEGEEKRAKETEIKKRLLYVQAVDTARCLEANVLTAPQDGDVGSIMGLGFAPQTGGAISLIDQVGIKKFVAECDEFAKKYGPQFEVPKLLRDMAAKGQSFYGHQTAQAA
ncbi:3-hydroxyacyl-CoA dehydrogenase / enoyl-CoA hydratase / 3-hydroxybutyryl-CoA epimerase [Enhydrobacter aerosaccus]|uniref:enoyl-CoA hydratase n=1 Tax=Enhydrobacter aerosaccus TaxID=225324 RepID=A0A1T4KDP6_9HYPH|nr:3-hydroxyacyl-CoA dehydrogenase NAD-binding domain-containing protein [Enhydrobacter aerosaccus]SJZ40487.1 3-hydroxyacyl-CoA dehydrogenase / enoyl-CoA hydratase / 3-hydroxybutyryl-CoA epimerase [Enhydrobacter aerosaccus]